jgi:hypothetical protein
MVCNFGSVPMLCNIGENLEYGLDFKFTNTKVVPYHCIHALLHVHVYASYFYMI